MFLLRLLTLPAFFVPLALGVYSDAEGYLYYNLAAASYCDPSKLPAWDCEPCVRSKTSVHSLKVYQNSSTDARAYTAVVTPLGGEPTIVLSVRGTESLENWIQNLKFLKTDREMSCDGCKVHSGFLDVWESIAQDVIRELKSLRLANPHARLVLTGHSLGGAVTTLAGYALSADLKFPVDNVYTYGSPRVGNSAFASNAPPAGVTGWRVTHHRDIVPHLPPSHVLGFHHVAREVFYDNDTHAYVTCDGTGEDDDCSRQYLVYSVNDHLTYFGDKIGVYGCGESAAASNSTDVAS